MTRELAFLTLYLAVAPSLAAAQRMLVLPLHIEPALGDAQRTKIAQALERALRAAGIEPVAAPATEPCSDDACVQRQRAAASAEHAVQLTVWRREGASDRSIGGVSVSMIDADGHRFSDGVSVDPVGPALASSVTLATQNALARLRRGPGPWLELGGATPGASVSIDGQPTGSVPGRFRVAGGLHRVMVEAPGFESFDVMVTVPRNVDALKRVTVELQPARVTVQTDARASSGSARVERSPWNYVIGGAAVVAGVVLSIGPVRSSLDAGECGRIEHGRCTGVVSFGALQAVQLGAAVLLVAGGGTIALWGPIRARVDSSSALIEARTSME